MRGACSLVFQDRGRVSGAVGICGEEQEALTISREAVGVEWWRQKSPGGLGHTDSTWWGRAVGEGARPSAGVYQAPFTGQNCPGAEL